MMENQETDKMFDDAEEIIEDEAREDISEDTVEDLRSMKLQLEGEIALLEGELERKREETDKKAREYTEFKAKVMEVNGYDRSMEDLVDEAKN